MATVFETDIYPLFFKKIVKDRTFFEYVNVTEVEAIEIAVDRSEGLLKESISKLTLQCTPDVDFFDYDATQFNFDFTPIEIDLITSIMKEKLFEKDELKLKVQVARFSTKDVTSFSPANERKTYSDLCKNIAYRNDVLIDKYASRDRITNKRKIIKYATEV